MDNRRRLELIRQEVRRKRQIALLDEAHRLEHLEVAEALAYAAELISREDNPCKSEINSLSSRRDGKMCRSLTKRIKSRCKHVGG